jgi:RNA polymerase sigma factor (sigma-70 family)
MVLALDDADLVGAALAGDSGAFGAIYDRYSSQVFTMCAHMLGNRDDAADATSDVFLVAAERLGQLRDPSRLRVWLLAIARHNIYRRSSQRSRAVPVAEVEDMTGPLATDHDLAESGAESSDLAQVLGDAAAGLDDGDRAVLELQLLGLEGADLADALGVAPDAAYQASFRMKERLERSLGALLVARQGRGDCGDLDQLLRAWDGSFSVLWRKRVARHVDKCEVCDRRRKAVPALLLGGVAGASTLLAAPDRLRGEVLSALSVGGAPGRPWPGDGFPPGPRRAGRRVVAALVIVLIALVALVGTLSADSSTPSVSTTSTTVSSTTVTTTMVTTTTVTTVLPDVPLSPGVPAVPDAPVSPTSTTVPSTTTTVPAGRPGSPSTKGTPTSPTTTSTTSTSTTTTTVRPPSPPKYPTYPNLPSFPRFTIPTSVPLY